PTWISAPRSLRPTPSSAYIPPDIPPKRAECQVNRAMRELQICAKMVHVTVCRAANRRCRQKRKKPSNPLVSRL
ncbi:MAG: hypothetical protein WC187_04840, partial [Bacillota bacterium]